MEDLQMKTGIVWGDWHPLETVTWLSSLPVEDCCLSFKSQRKLFFDCMWQDIFFQVEKRFDLLLKGSWYRMDYIKMRTWNQYTEKGFQHADEFVQLMASTKGRNNRFSGSGNPLLPRGDIEEMVSGQKR